MKVIARPRRELILYATPSGELGDRCAEFFSTAARQFGPTTAQTYPPHCTLTGFFHRADGAAETTIEQVTAALVADGAVAPPGAVEVVGLRHDHDLDWVGLDVRSPWLAEVAGRVLADAPAERRDDPIRFKSWLHVSLAYGDRPGRHRDLAVYHDLAERMVDPSAPVAWTVGLWERRPDATWHRLTPPVTSGDSPQT